MGFLIYKQKFNYNYAAALAGVFLCALIAQLPLVNIQKNLAQSETQPWLSASEQNLLQNAATPIYLSEDRSAAVRQLENLIQETDIRQIRMYTSDQKLVAQVLNSSVPETFRQTHIENISIDFQGTLAGSVQLDIAYAETESSILEDGLIITTKSLLITLVAWLLSIIYFRTRSWLLPKLHTKNRAPGILEAESHSSHLNSSSSLLIYVYLLPEESLSKDKKSLRDCISSFSRKLEGHLRIYGGRILSLSEDCIVCRMASGQSHQDLQQALTFCWGIARPMIYKNEQDKFQLDVKSLLHKTECAAKSGAIYKAISEVGPEMKSAVMLSTQEAHISKSVLSVFSSELGNPTNFDYVASKDYPDLYRILSVKKSVDVLWLKQEAMVNEAHT